MSRGRSAVQTVLGRTSVYATGADEATAAGRRDADGCGCRKPASGLVAQARRDLSLGTAQSFVIGDRAIDIALARNIGGTAVFVLSGYRPEDEQAHMAAHGLSPDYTAKDLSEAVDWVLKRCHVPASQEKFSLPRRGNAN